MISETRILLRARTTGVFSPSACWNFCRKNPGRAERRGRRRFTKGRRGLTLPGLTARLSSVVRPHDGAARSRAAGLQGRGIWGGKPGIGVHRSHCAIRRSSAPHRPPVTCFASPSGRRAAAPCFWLRMQEAALLYPWGASAARCRSLPPELSCQTSRCPIWIESKYGIERMERDGSE
jgi:hypothetical protein